jgi:hypothetical protein
MDKEIAFQDINLFTVTEEISGWVVDRQNTPVFDIKIWHAKDLWYGKIFYKDTPMPEDEQIDDYDM